MVRYRRSKPDGGPMYSSLRITSLLILAVACGSKDGGTASVPPIPPVLDSGGPDDTGANADGGSEDDADSDGYDASVDCDDTNPLINPGAIEECDEIDNNCDGSVDEGLTRTYFPDIDLDGYGDNDSPLEACSRPDGYISRDGDCDDTDPLVNPEGTELCNDIDDNCDGEVDGEDAADPTTWYADSDNDGFGNPEYTVASCVLPAGFVTNALDCNDFDALMSPFGIEMCDGVDNDCNGEIDEASSADAREWFRDADGDGWGRASVTARACSVPSGFVDNDEDCDDTRASVSPDGTEVCNSMDDNCDGAVDEGFAMETYYRDSDGDTYGDATDPIVSCTAVAGFSATAGDCDDSEYWANPGLSELCDEIDNDCDGIVDEDLVYTDFVPDADGDGFGDASGAVVTDCIPPAGHVVDTSDCDDGDASVNPGAVETCNGIDDNCTGGIDEGLPEYTYFGDEDGDGHGIPAERVTACTVPPGYSELNDDCDDTDDRTFPGAYEFCDGEDDDCNGLVDDDCGYSRDYVMFVTDNFLGSSSSSWLESREDADAYCEDYAASNGIAGDNFKIVYSTPDEDARDYLDYVPGTDFVYDRSGSLIDDADLYDGTSPVLPDMKSWTIVGSGADGRFMECSGSYPSGSWPICQSCSQKFACGSSTAAVFSPLSCCWSGTRAIVCMGEMTAG